MLKRSTGTTKYRLWMRVGWLWPLLLFFFACPALPPVSTGAPCVSDMDCQQRQRCMSGTCTWITGGNNESGGSTEGGLLTESTLPEPPPDSLTPDEPSAPLEPPSEPLSRETKEPGANEPPVADEPPALTDSADAGERGGPKEPLGGELPDTGREPSVPEMPRGEPLPERQCAPDDATIYPGAKELCDGKDNDCDGDIDEDFVKKGLPCTKIIAGCREMGVTICTSDGRGTVCDVTQPVGPQVEVCDGKDNNCDGMIDENIKRPCKSACGTGLETCQAGAFVGCTAPQPKFEFCNGFDDDCDGKTDEDFADKGKPCTSPGAVDKSCETTGTFVCKADGSGTTCNAVPQTPKTWYRDEDQDNFGNALISRQSCTQPKGYVLDKSDCYDKNKEAFPGQTKTFGTNRGDGSFDYNCDGQISYRYDKQVKCIRRIAHCDASPQGYDGNRPACGKDFDFYKDCTASGLGCSRTSGDRERRKQECR